MGFFKSLKGDHPDTIGGSSSHDGQSYAPPPGPPPSRISQNHHTPSSHSTNYQPPPGPPPRRKELSTPPPGPPFSRSQGTDSPPPYHDWTAIPDTSLFPPPPSLGHDVSPTSNASLADSDRAREFCQRHPLMRPHQPTREQHVAVQNGDVRLMKPREYNGRLVMLRTGAWRGSTRAGSKDSCLLTNLPMYFASADSPLYTRSRKTIYYEIKVCSWGLGRGNDECSIALGFSGIPYPTWRMPGWQRGSLAVHGDDGRKYINDSFGGKDFTSPFKEGQRIGIGMTFSVSDSPPEYGAAQGDNNSMKVEVFLTRDGRRDAQWDLHEQLDATDDGGVDGLEGQYDLFGAIGVFGGVEFEAFFDNQDWLWKPA